MADKIGLIQIYTGDGKGKTTAALGLALRAVGRGLKVKVFQFMKAPNSSGEHFSAARLGPDLEIIPVGRKGFVIKKPPDPEDVRLAADGLNQARAVVDKGTADLLILDELDVALSLGLLPLESTLALLSAKPVAMEIVLTGRGAPKEIMDLADLVTEMRLIKHPYQKGVPAREGIEY